MPMIIQAPKTTKRPPVDLYPHIHFDSYEFTQFPEWVVAPEGWAPSDTDELEKLNGHPVQPFRVLVRDEDEKRRVMSGGTVKSEETDEKTMLREMAARKGIKWDERWGVDTARSKVQG